MLNINIVQARGEQGSLRYDLVSNRAGTKWFIRPRMESKDSSWREAIVELVVKVVITIHAVFIFVFPQSVELRKRPRTFIPTAGPEHLIRGKKLARPDLMQAIAKHQTRMSSNINQ